MIQITVQDRFRAAEDDPLGREWVGAWEGMTPEEVYETARGVWRLNRANFPPFNAGHSLAIVVWRDEVIGAFTVEGLEEAASASLPNRRALVGRPLQPGEPAYEEYVGKAPYGRFRNPIRYVS